MTVEPQMNLHVKQYKMFNTYKFEGRWKHKKNNNQNFISQEDRSSIILTLIGGMTETISFKKGANIIVKNDLIEYYAQDLL